MIGFRVDANEQIATGHLMRCIAIAMECEQQGEACIFLLAEDKETDRLIECGLSYHVLQTQWNDLEKEEHMMKQIVEEEELEWLVVDSYQATSHYLAYLKQFVRVLYLDDMGNEKYPVTAILHYSSWPGASDFEEKYRGTGTKILEGMRYVPLRKEFREEWTSVARENSILITTGGTDICNVSVKLLKTLKKKKEFQGYIFHVIVGSMNQNEEVLEQLAEEDHRILLHRNVKNMGYFMHLCSLAVSAGGTTLYELCASRIPTVCFSFAENQRVFSEEMGKHQIMLYSGDARENEAIAEIICEKLLEYCKCPEKATAYSNNMGRLVDGKGAQRIAEFLCAK